MTILFISLQPQQPPLNEPAGPLTGTNIRELSSIAKLPVPNRAPNTFPDPEELGGKECCANPLDSFEKFEYQGSADFAPILYALLCDGCLIADNDKR